MHARACAAATVSEARRRKQSVVEEAAVEKSMIGCLEGSEYTAHTVCRGGEREAEEARAVAAEAGGARVPRYAMIARVYAIPVRRVIPGGGGAAVCCEYAAAASGEQASPAMSVPR